MHVHASLALQVLIKISDLLCSGTVVQFLSKLLLEPTAVLRQRNYLQASYFMPNALFADSVSLFGSVDDSAILGSRPSSVQDP